MDIYCPKCSEPWDIDCIHEIADLHETTYSEARDRFRSEGCVALGTRHNNDTGSDDLRALATAALMDLMGDDMDGVASMLDDIDYVGGFHA